MTRATGETYYTVEDDSTIYHPRYIVFRINPIGQGWAVASYRDEDTARDVAHFLMERSGDEVR